MDQQTRKILTETFAEVMEGLAFMFVEPAAIDDLPEPGAHAARVSITFSGHAAGCMTIAAPASLCTRLAADMLGTEPDDPGIQTKGGDALGETLNTVCGRFLTAMAGDEPVFCLTTPELTGIDVLEWDSQKVEEGTLLFRIDEYPIMLTARYGIAT